MAHCVQMARNFVHCVQMRSEERQRGSKELQRGINFEGSATQKIITEPGVEGFGPVGSTRSQPQALLARGRPRLQARLV